MSASFRAFAIFHQRYSTNTFPTWRLAQPFRMLAHNGEINTLKGNVNWMKNHEFKMASELFGEAGDDIKPIIQPGGSDSAALDAVFEVLVRAGRTAPLAKTLLVPEAWSKKASTMPDSHRAMYAYANAVMEPWDGPAALAATDGRWVIAGMDRNGLRPQRYAVTEDGLLFVGSEAGMVVLDEARIVRKGRVGPGQMIALDLDEGRFYEDRAIKDKLAGEYPYEEWTKNDRRAGHRSSGPAPSRACSTKGICANARPRRASRIEDLELILHPMVEDGKEAVGSMGDDTPLAVLSRSLPPAVALFPAEFQPGHQSADRPAARRTRDELENAFPQSRQRAGTRRKPDRSLRAGKPDHLHRHVSAHEGTSRRAILRNRLRVSKCTTAGRRKVRSRRAIDRIRAEAEDAVRQGYSHLILTDERVSTDLARHADDLGHRRCAFASRYARTCAAIPRSTSARPNASTRIILRC